MNNIKENDIYSSYKEFVHYLVDNVSPFIRMEYDLKAVDIRDAKSIILESKRRLDAIGKEIDILRKEKFNKKNKKDE